MINNIASVSTGVVLLAIVLTAVLKRKNVFTNFTDGVLVGMKTTLSVAPSVVALVLMVNIMQQSGILDCIGTILRPMCQKFGFPTEVLPLALIRPISGSGALAVLDNILSQNSPDEFVGRVASVMMGSTETTFYVIAMYFGSVNITKTGKTVVCALLADFVGIICSVITVSLFF